MKIVHITPFAVPCGIATYADNFIFGIGSEYVGKGIENIVVAEEILGGWYEIGYKSNVIIIRCWNRLRDTNVVRICDTINAINYVGKIDIVHIQHELGIFYDNFWLSLLKKLNEKKIKIVVTVHNVLLEGTGRELAFVGMRYADRLIVHSEGARDELIKWGLRKEKIKIIPHGTEVNNNVVDSVVAKRILKIPEDKKLILSFGFINRTKKFVENLCAMKVLGEKRGLTNDFCYAIVGKANVIEDLVYNIKYLDEIIKVKEEIFPEVMIKSGFVSNDMVEIWFSAADICLFNYGFTGYSTSGAARLAMTYGKASVTSKAYMFDDFNESFSCKVEIERNRDLIEALDFLLSNDKIRNEMGEKAKKYGYLTSWNNVAIKHIDLYKEICGDIVC